jgi:2-C-methyl-D-erythritol 2,4-cyclodiphosphate synthase
MAMRMGIGYDVHRKTDGRPLVLGGLRFEGERGLEGHSDADVLAHAIGDALLGAVALGDLGTHFPPGEERWRGVSSLRLLRLIRAMLEGVGARIVNIDATVVAQSPHLAPHRDAMRQALARGLKLGIGQVSVKATTNEGLDAMGRDEGIAAWAIATVEVAD